MTTPDRSHHQLELTGDPAQHEHIREPHRTCVGCRRSFPQRVLLRCAIGQHGACVSRTAPGRGAWLCSLACFDIAAKRRSFERAWKQTVDADSLATLRNDVEGVITNMTELLVVGSRPDRPALMMKG